MSSSSVVSTSDSSSSNEGTSAHTQAEVSHSPRGPPRQLCQCTKCVGQISQKLYVCAQHIQRFGCHRGRTLGASSSHVGSRMKPPPYVLSQGVLATIGNALLEAFTVGIGTSHEAKDSASCRREGPTLFPYGGLIYKRRHWNMILTQHPECKTFALEMDTFAGSVRRHSDGRVIDGDPIRSGNIAGFINSTVGTRPKRRANCDQVFVEGPPPAPYGQTYHEDHCLVIVTRTIRSGDELFTHYE
ncbi:unnamed protein product [Sphagnum tenellum]